MSLLQQVAARIGATSEDLPLPEVRVAAERLRLAAGLLGFVLAASVSRAPVPTLGGATERLDGAAAALYRAQESLAGYLSAIGVGRGGPVRENLDWRAALTATTPASATAPPASGSLPNWWAQRVAALTQSEPGIERGAEPGIERGAETDAERGAEIGPAAADVVTSSPELLRRAVARALAGDRAGLHRELAGAVPAVGLGLSAITPAVLGQLTAELAGHPVGPDDVQTVRRAVRPRIRELLPGLPEPVLAAMIARLCRAPVPAVQAHPGDGAVAGTVFVAGLLHALRRDADYLSLEAYLPTGATPAYQPTAATVPATGTTAGTTATATANAAVGGRAAGHAPRRLVDRGA